MAFQRLQNSMMVFTICLVLVITSAGNFKVSAAAQQFEAQTLEGGCPVTQDDFERVRNNLLQDIGPLIEQGFTCNGTPGWRQVVFINMTDTRHNCPPGLNLTSHSKRTCGRAHSNREDCSSTTFSVRGSQYSQVCGRIRGYQVGSTEAFRGYLQFSQSIEGYYVGGVSLTHGAAGGRQHVWSFAAGYSEVDNRVPLSTCPCDTSDETVVSPPFIGNDYFCESGLDSPWIGQFNTLFPDDPLWDGHGCTSNSTCCQFNNPPWFTKNLLNSTTDDIELRLCFTGTSSSDDTPIELIELYVQ